MLNSDKGSKVTIEDLLRLKRTEQPAPEFWVTFERELRQKQLTALLEKRPWWQGLRQFVTNRSYLPVGATAVLAFTLVSLRYYSPVQVAQSEGPSAGPAAAFKEPGEAQLAAQASVPVSSALISRDSQVVPQIDDRTVVAPSIPTLAAKAPDAAEFTVQPTPVESPSARSIAAAFKNLEQSEPELINAVLGSRLSSPARVQPPSTPIVELASLSSNGSKRSRLLANYNDRQVSPEPTAPDSVRERLARRLGDTDYTERFSRIGLKGSQVSLKF